MWYVDTKFDIVMSNTQYNNDDNRLKIQNVFSNNGVLITSILSKNNENWTIVDYCIRIVDRNADINTAELNIRNYIANMNREFNTLKPSNIHNASIIKLETIPNIEYLEGTSKRKLEI